MSTINTQRPTELQEPMPAHIARSSSDVISEQPTFSKYSMKAERQTMELEPKVLMRGGGCIGDIVDAIVCFECCKGICECC